MIGFLTQVGTDFLFNKRRQTNRPGKTCFKETINLLKIQVKEDKVYYWVYFL